MKARPLGDTALGLTLDAADPRPGEFADALRRDAPPGLIDAIAAFDGVAIVYDPAAVGGTDAIASLIDHARRTAAAMKHGLTTPTPTSTLIELPVVYGGDDGPDLASLAVVLGLSTDTLIEHHAAPTYTVAAIGFVPGFAYLDGLADKLRAARRSTPRVRVPAGSVAIGGPYTGVYPVDSPGGWHVIGRTPRRLFDPAEPAMTPWRVGDRVKFVPQRAERE